MLTATGISIGLLAAILVANLAATVVLVRSRFYSRRQKLAQLAIVWCVPLLGVVGVWAFLRAQYNWGRFDTRAFPEDSQKGVGAQVQNAIHDSFGGGGGTASD